MEIFWAALTVYFVWFIVAPLIVIAGILTIFIVWLLVDLTWEYIKKVWKK